jgi:hypothetical protein
MALSSSGSISFTQIKNEFGDSNGATAGVSLGKYRVSQTFGALKNMPLDEGVPKSGEISMGDLRGKRLNVVVDYYSGGTEHRPNTGKQRYQQEKNTECVGTFRNRPTQTQGTKVWLHINKTIGSQGAPQTPSACAFRTGNWQSGTQLRVYAGEEAAIRGRGGQGGKGGDGRNENGGDGANASSAIGVQFSNGTTILTSHSQAVAAGGGGGGGGGGGARQEDRGADRTAGGGGGGGGAGLPAGTGGGGGTQGEGRHSSGESGDGGSTTAKGDGGKGGDNGGGEARGGDGGNGGDPGASGANGESGQGEDGEGGGGSGGQGGEWLRTGGNSVQTGGWQGTKQGTASSGGVT